MAMSIQPDRKKTEVKPDGARKIKVNYRSPTSRGTWNHPSRAVRRRTHNSFLTASLSHSNMYIPYTPLTQKVSRLSQCREAVVGTNGTGERAERSAHSHGHAASERAESLHIMG